MGLVWERGCADKEMGATGEKGRDNAAGVGHRADVLETRQWVVGPALKRKRARMVQARGHLRPALLVILRDRIPAAMAPPCHRPTVL